MSAMIDEQRIAPAELSLAWDESKCQNAVYVYCRLKNHELVIPNSCLFSWEADVLSVNRSGFISEFEIKVTRADFKADAKKQRTKWLENPNVDGFFGPRSVSRPNYFYYAVPTGLIMADEIPDYAGLIYLERQVESHQLYYNTISEVKKAKRLHSDKITEQQYRQMERALVFRYWRLRLNGRDGKPEHCVEGEYY